MHRVKSAQTDPDRGWLDYAIQFRHRGAIKPKDKLFAFVGLLRSSLGQNHPEFDYQNPAEKIFTRFAAFYIPRNRSLSLLTLAEVHHALECSWAVDWSKLTSPDYDTDPWFSTAEDPRKHVNRLWTGGLLSSPWAHPRSYSAAAGRAASVE